MRIKESSNRMGTRRRGAAGVEFAIIAPVVVFLFMGMVEVTRAVQVKHMLSDSARSAARWAIRPDSSDAIVSDVAKEILKDNGCSVTNAKVIVQVNDKTNVSLEKAKTGDKISVQVTIPAGEVGWIGSTFLADDALHSEVVVMMRQR